MRRCQARGDTFATLPGLAIETEPGDVIVFDEHPIHGWDGGYDADLYPTYGPHWRSSCRPWLARLDQLGAHDAAAEEERALKS